MAGKSSGKSGGSKSKAKGGMSVADHRKAAEMLQAKARIHHAQADLKEALNPPKKTRYGARGYPC